MEKIKTTKQDKNLWPKLSSIKSIHWWGWISGLMFFGLITFVFYLAPKLYGLFDIWSKTPWEPKIGFDNVIPLVPYFFAQIYVIAYIWWIIAPIIICITNKENIVDFTFTTLLSFVLGLIIFMAVPTIIHRDPNHLDQILNGKGFSWFVIKKIYQGDGWSESRFLFPSFHCLSSILCYLGLFRQKNVSLFSRLLNLLLAILVCLSTLFVKQHYFLDWVVAMVIAIGSFALMKFVIKPGKRIYKKNRVFISSKKK